MRVCAVKGTKTAACGAISRPRRPNFCLARTTIDRPSGVSSDKRRELRGIGQLGFADAVERQEVRRLAVAQGDGAGLVEQQRVDVTRRLDGAAGHRQHVVLNEPVHAGDADRREQSADGGGDETDQQRHQHEGRLRGIRVDREGLQGDDRHQEDDGQAGQQDVQRDLVGCLLPLGAFDERDHPVQERLTRIGGHPHLDPVRQHAGAARHRRAVTARLADDRGRLAGDCRLVDRRDALEDLAVGRDELAGAHHHDIAAPQRRRRHGLRRRR